MRRQEALRAAFSRQLIDTQEGDRRRIAAGLHDGLSQSLIVIKNWAMLGRKTLPPDHAAAGRLDEIESTAAQALGELRDVVHDLGAAHLERLGLSGRRGDVASSIAFSGIEFTPGGRAQLQDVDALKSPLRIVQEASITS